MAEGGRERANEPTRGENAILLSHAQASLLGPFVNLVTRTRDHVERLDDGAVHAVDDLAGTLRTLLCSGRGNNVLPRFAKAFTVSPVRLSLAPRKDDAVRIALGSIPTREPGAVADGAQTV